MINFFKHYITPIKSLCLIYLYSSIRCFLSYWFYIKQYIFNTNSQNTIKYNEYQSFYIKRHSQFIKYLNLPLENTKKNDDTNLQKKRISNWLNIKKNIPLNECLHNNEPNITTDVSLSEVPLTDISCNKNLNIDFVFYDRKMLFNILKNEDNEIEKKWKTRILIDYTPFGNIIMFYDVYKSGFSYYCDQSNISHYILNAVAMKYVMNFLCLNFFIDELSVKEFSSPFIKFLEIEEKHDNQIKKDVFNSLSINSKVDVKNLPFIKKGEKPLNLHNKSQKFNKPVSNVEKRINKFIYLGKINNFSIISKQNVKSTKEIAYKNVNYNEYKMQKARNFTTK
jgi:hypothetical protein